MENGSGSRNGHRRPRTVSRDRTTTPSLCRVWPVRTQRGSRAGPRRITRPRLRDLDRIGAGRVAGCSDRGTACRGSYAAASHRASPGSLGTVPSTSSVIRTRSNLDRSNGTLTTVTPGPGVKIPAKTASTPLESQIP